MVRRSLSLLLCCNCAFQIKTNTHLKTNSWIRSRKSRPIRDNQYGIHVSKVAAQSTALNHTLDPYYSDLKVRKMRLKKLNNLFIAIHLVNRWHTSSTRPEVYILWHTFNIKNNKKKNCPISCFTITRATYNIMVVYQIFFASVVTIRNEQSSILNIFYVWTK